MLQLEENVEFVMFNREKYCLGCLENRQKVYVCWGSVPELTV